MSGTADQELCEPQVWIEVLQRRGESWVRVRKQLNLFSLGQARNPGGVVLAEIQHAVAEVLQH